MSVDPVGEFDVGADPVLHQVRMRLQKLRVDHQQADDELSVGPERAFIEKQTAIAFVDQPRGPWLGSPGRIQIFFQE